MPQGERAIGPVLSVMAPLPRGVFFRPLEAVRRDHNRQLNVSQWILQQANEERIEPFQESVDELLGFFCRNLVLHHEDEEEDLFPMLRERCRPQDSIDAVLAELIRDHASEGFLMRDIVADLHRVVERQDLESPSRFFVSLRLFAEGQQRHITWENDVVLPLARRRLGDIDLEALGSSMVARRKGAHLK
jgi:hemerythrin-like domain-containing protein